MNNPSMQTWLLARTSGMVAYLLLTVAVVVGLTIKARLFGRAVPMPVITAVHQTLSTIGIVAVVVHAAMIILDTKVNIPLLAAFIPGLSPYRTIATGLGVIAIELWVVIHFSFALRRRIGMDRWRKLHRLAFGVWAISAVHGIAAGTDSVLPWAQQMYAISAAIVVGLLAWRLLNVTSSPGPGPRRPRIQVDSPRGVLQ